MTGCDYTSGFYFRDLPGQPESVYYHSHREPYGGGGGGLVRCRWFMWAGGSTEPTEIKALFSTQGEEYLKAVPERFYFMPAKIVD